MTSSRMLALRCWQAEACVSWHPDTHWRAGIWHSNAPVKQTAHFAIEQLLQLAFDFQYALFGVSLHEDGCLLALDPEMHAFHRDVPRKHP